MEGTEVTMEESIDKFDPLSELLNYRYPWLEALQAVQAIPIYFLCKILILPLAPSTTLLASLANFLMFLFSLLVFDFNLLEACSPPPLHRLSLVEFLVCLLKLKFNRYGDVYYRQRLCATLDLYCFIACSGISATLAITSITAASSVVSTFDDFGELEIRGFVAGLIYAFHRRRWVVEFPVVQRPPFFRYKLGVGKAVIEAIKLSIAAYLLTLVPSIYYKGQLTRWDLIKGEIVFYLACLVVFLCWELNRNILQVIFTERLVFAPPKGSTAAESNPSDSILAVLEKPTRHRLDRYLACYDLCMVSESNAEVDTWRRDAFFEETGETYKRVITVCLNPRDLSSDQLCVSNELNEPFYDFQTFAWCARAASSLTKEDRFGVARRTGSYGTTMCTLLSCLLAVEIVTQNKKHSPHYPKAYSMADILKTSVYQIVSVFQQELIDASRYGRLQEDWITSDRPLLYGTHDLLVQKLHMFLESQAYYSYVITFSYYRP